MTNEEAIRCLSVHSSTNGSGLCTDKQHYEAKQMAIKALEQEPCEDAISRQAVLDIVNIPLNIRRDEIIKKLPSVNPQDCDTCEAGNPCLYCKHEFEPQESEDQT